MVQLKRNSLVGYINTQKGNFCYDYAYDLIFILFIDMKNGPRASINPSQITAINNQRYTKQNVLYEDINEKGLHMKKVSLGLTNEVNTCFINSALQCLLNIKQLAEYYLTAETQAINSLHKQIRYLVKAMWQDKSDKNYPKYEMKYLYREIVDNFELYRLNYRCQMDSPEFIQHLLNFMRTYPLNKKSRGKDIIQELFQGKFHTKIICQQPNTRGQTGEIHTRCNSKIVDIKQPFLTVPLTVLQYKQINSRPYQTYLPKFSNIIRKITGYGRKNHNIRKFQEKICLIGKDGWYCKQCERDAMSEQEISFHSIGKVLIIQLLKFQGETKIDSLITYPEKISLRHSKDQHGKQKTESRYLLIGVICHLGSTIRFGHYSSFTYDQQQKKWYRQSDSYVTQTNLQECLNNPDAYVLFYRKL